MTTRKMWPGWPGSSVPTEPPGDIPEREKRNHPEVSINGVTYRWAPGQESGVPPEALAVWRAFLEANE